MFRVVDGMRTHVITRPRSIGLVQLFEMVSSVTTDWRMEMAAWFPSWDESPIHRMRFVPYQLSHG
jgi:hypothetical protein